MNYLIPAGIVASYAVFWFAMTEPAGRVGKQIATKVHNKMRQRRANRPASKSKPPA